MAVCLSWTTQRRSLFYDDQTRNTAVKLIAMKTRWQVVSLVEQFYAKVDAMAALGIERETILSQSLITPSCGAGTLSLEFAEKVLMLTRDISQIIRKEVDTW